MSKVALIVGHGVSTNGVRDSGCTYGNDTEANLMFEIVGVAVASLRADGFDVMTDWDTNNDRNCTYTIRDANAWGADIYTSCHCDWDQAPSGTYPICYPGSTEGYKLASCLNEAVMSANGLGTRGILQRDDMEVANTNMTACIMELGSIKADNAKLHDSQKMGLSVANGIRAYFGKASVNTSTTISAPASTATASTVSASSSNSSILLQVGSEGSDVSQLQRDLRALAYEDANGNAISVDGDFGPATKAAVERLQRCHGLEVDGIYGPKSDSALMSEMSKVQTALKSKGYDIPVDGAFGPVTENAVKAFQSANGLTADGIIGNNTLKALGL